MNTKLLVVTLFQVAIARQLVDRGQRDALIYFEPKIEQYDDNEYVLAKHETDDRQKILFPTSKENESSRRSYNHYSVKPGRLDHRLSSATVTDDAREVVTENDKIIFKDDDNPEPNASIRTPYESNRNDKFDKIRKNFNDVYMKKVLSAWEHVQNVNKDKLFRFNKGISEERSEHILEAEVVFPGDSSPTKIKLDFYDLFTTTGRNPYGVYNRASFYVPCESGEVRVYGVCVKSPVRT